MQRLYTIGIAVYNICEDYLRACIESVISNRREDIEIIIVDDCSQRWCSEIIQEYLPKDDRIRYLRCEKNIGISAVRNMIIEKASGEWILFVDGDDVVSDGLWHALPTIGESGMDIVVLRYECFADKDTLPKGGGKALGRLYDVDISTTKRMALCAATRCPPEEMPLDDGSRCRLHCGCVFATAYRRSFLRENGISFNTALTVAEDSMFNAAAYLAAKKVALLPVITYFYRVNQGSVTNRCNPGMQNVTDRYIAASRAFLEENFKDDDKACEYFWKYRCTGAVLDNFERNIFHKKNKKTRRERKNDFERLLGSEPYKETLERFEPSDCEIHKTRLVMRLAKRRCFAMLDFSYRHNFVFVIYGGLKRRFGKRG